LEAAGAFEAPGAGLAGSAVDATAAGALAGAVPLAVAVCALGAAVPPASVFFAGPLGVVGEGAGETLAGDNVVDLFGAWVLIGAILSGTKRQLDFFLQSAAPPRTYRS